MATDSGFEPRWVLIGSFGEYKPCHRRRWEVGFRPSSRPSPSHPHSLIFLFPLRQERSTRLRYPRLRQKPSSRPRILRSQPLPTPHFIDPDHHVDPQEQRPSVFFAQRF